MLKTLCVLALVLLPSFDYGSNETVGGSKSNKTASSSVTSQDSYCLNKNTVILGNIFTIPAVISNSVVLTLIGLGFLTSLGLWRGGIFGGGG